MKHLKPHALNILFRAQHNAMCELAEKAGEAKAIQPAALWDLHYLRELELSGFIDELIQEQPVAP